MCALGIRQVSYPERQGLCGLHGALLACAFRLRRAHLTAYHIMCVFMCMYVL